MITVFERATVRDYRTWRDVFDGFAPTLKAKGVVASSVYQSVDDPNDLTVAHDFETIEDAKAFLASSELQDARSDAGVVSGPTVWFTSKV